MYAISQTQLKHGQDPQVLREGPRAFPTVRHEDGHH